MHFPITTNAFSNWPAFERQLREVLAADLDPEVAERVMQRTVRSFKALHVRKLADNLEVELAADIGRYEAWNTDFRAAKMKVLWILIDSFVAIERLREQPPSF